MRRPPRPSRASRGGSAVEHQVHPVVLGRRVECLGRRLGAGERQRARPEPEAVEDPPGDRGLGDEGEDSEPSAAVGAAEHVDGEDLAEEVGPGNPVGARGSLAGRRPRSSRRGGGSGRPDRALEPRGWASAEPGPPAPAPSRRRDPSGSSERPEQGGGQPGRTRESHRFRGGAGIHAYAPVQAVSGPVHGDSGPHGWRRERRGERQTHLRQFGFGKGLISGT